MCLLDLSLQAVADIRQFDPCVDVGALDGEERDHAAEVDSAGESVLAIEKIGGNAITGCFVGVGVGDSFDDGCELDYKGKGLVLGLGKSAAGLTYFLRLGP